MENKKQTPISSYSAAGAAKLHEMAENPDVYADFLKFQGRVFKHNANVALEFFVQKPDAQFIATREQWERTDRSVAQSSKAVPFMDKNGGVVGFYDFSQIEGDDPPHRWTIHVKNAAEIKTALGIPKNGNLISGAVQNTLTPAEVTASMAALRVPPQEFRKFSSSFVSTVQCIVSGRLEVGGSRFNVVPDAAMFHNLRTESEKLGFLNLAANAARKILLKIERAALDLEAAERNERNERENQLRELHENDRGRMAADSGRGFAGSSERSADKQDHAVESGTQGRSDGISVNSGSEERKQHKMDADVLHGDSKRSGVLVQARSDERTVQPESDGTGSVDGGRTDREIRDGLDELHGGALPGGSDGDAVSSSLPDGGTVGGEVSTGVSGDTGEGLREYDPTSDKRQLRGESEMESGNGLLRGQHSDEREGLSSGDESLTAKLNSVFSVENNETLTDSVDVFVLDEDIADISDEEQLVQLALEIKQGEELVTELMRERNYAEVSKIAQELEEMNRRADALKEEIQKRTITEDDVQVLRSIKPPRKSVQNLLEHEVAQTSKFESLLHSEMGEKSAYEMRKSNNSWLEDESKTVTVVKVQKRDIPKKITDMRKRRDIPRGTFVNNDMGIEVIFGKKSVDEIIAKAIPDAKRGFSMEARLSALYQMKDLIENAICFDSRVSNYDSVTSKNKSPNTLFIHRMHGVIDYESEKFLVNLSVEESYITDKEENFKGTSNRLYSIRDMKLTPVDAHRIFSPTTDNSNITADTSTDVITVSIPQLYELVKTYDKSFFENPNAPGREAREAELYAHAEYLDAVESAATGKEVTAETDKQIERIAESRGIGTEEARKSARQIVDTNINFSSGEAESEPDVSFSEKVHAAFAEVAQNHKYTARQQKFLDRLEKFVAKHHVTKNMIDEMAKLPAFHVHYNDRKSLSRSLFGGRLGSLERELTDALQRQLAKQKVDTNINSNVNIAELFQAYLEAENNDVKFERISPKLKEELQQRYWSETTDENASDWRDKLPPISQEYISTFDGFVAIGLDVLDDDFRNAVRAEKEKANAPFEAIAVNYWGENRAKDLSQHLVMDKFASFASPKIHVTESETAEKIRYVWKVRTAEETVDTSNNFSEAREANEAPLEHENIDSPTYVMLSRNAFIEITSDLLAADETIANAYKNSDQQSYRLEIDAGINRIFTEVLTGVRDIGYTVSEIAPLYDTFQKDTNFRKDIQRDVAANVDFSLFAKLSENNRKKIIDRANELETSFHDDVTDIAPEAEGEQLELFYAQTNEQAIFNARPEEEQAAIIGQMSLFEENSEPEKKVDTSSSFSEKKGIRLTEKAFTDFAYNVIRDDETVRNAHEDSDRQNYQTEVRKAVDRLVTDLIIGQQEIENYTISDISAFVNAFHANETVRNRIDSNILERVDATLTRMEETRRIAQELGMPFSDKFSNGVDDEFDPYTYDGSIAPEDFEKVQQVVSLIEKLTEDNIDKFYVNQENETMTWVYFNPDSSKGGQLVYNTFDFDTLNEAVKAPDMLYYLTENGRITLCDVTSEDFLVAANEFIQSDEDFNSLGLNHTDIEEKLCAIIENPEQYTDSKKIDTNSNFSFPETAVPKRKPTRAERLYKQFTEMFPDIANGTHSYERYGKEGDAFEPLSVEHLGGDTYGFMTFYVQNGDIMRDPDFTFKLDHDNQTLTILEYQQDGVPIVGTVYQSVFDENDHPDLKLLAALEQNFAQNLKNAQTAERPLTAFSDASGNHTELESESPDNTPESEKEINDSTPELREVLNAFSTKHGLGEVNVAPAKYGWSLSEKMQDGAEHPMGEIHNPEYGMPFTPETLQTALENFEKAAADRGQDISDLYGRRAVASIHGGAAPLPEVQTDLPEITYASNPSGKISDNIDAIRELLRLEEAERKGKNPYDPRANQYNSKQASDASCGSIAAGAVCRSSLTRDFSSMNIPENG